MANIIPNSEVRLIKNVPFSNNYRNVVSFTSRSAQETYFKTLPNKMVDTFKYVRTNGSLKVPFFKDEILDYNYLMFKNKAYGDRYFYAFITNVSYINPNTSLVSFEIDVFQTWFMDVSFQPTYIEREHCQRWDSSGNPIINTIPEGLDYGSEYVTKGFKRLYDLSPKARYKWLVIAFALNENDFVNEPDLYTQCTIGNGIMTNLQYGVLPIPEMGINGYALQVNGEFTFNPFTIIQELQNSSALSNKVKSLYVTDFLPFNYTISTGKVEEYNAIIINSINLDIIDIRTQVDSQVSVPIPMIKYELSNSERNQVLNFTFNNKYQALKNGITESKLLMYPYSYNLLTDLQGNNFIIKNEYVNGDNINLAIRSSINISNKVTYTISNYLNNSQLANYNYLDNGIINNQPNRISVRDSYQAAYIQGNMNQIAQNITATQQQTALNNTIAQNNAIASTKITNAQNMSNTASNITQGVTNGLARGDLISAFVNGVGNAISSGIQSAGNTYINEVENQNMLNNTALRGNLANQQAIASANAKMQDTRNVADNVALQGGDVAFNYGYENMGVKIISKQITQEYIDILQDYFQKFGYAVHRVKLPNLYTRQSWNYVQTIDANIVGNIPEMYIEALQELFNNGITIWHTTDVGNYNLNNDEV